MICKDCKKEFILSPQEEDFFLSRGLALPKRCPACRKKRKEELNENQIKDILASTNLNQINLKDLKIKNPDKTLVIIGNGFDLAHGVHSSYLDFEKTIGKNSTLRFNMETYLNVKGNLWANLEESLGRLNYSLFLNPDILDMWLENFDAYNPDAQNSALTAAVETAIGPTFSIPDDLNRRFTKWLKTLKVDTSLRPFKFLHGNYKVLSFNYTEFIEDLYGATNVCYIHGCRKVVKGRKPDEIILGHTPGIENEEWDKVNLKPKKFKNKYKRYIFEAAIDMAINETGWYDESTTKNCAELIKKNKCFFDSLKGTEEIFIIGHSLSEVDFPYFEEINELCPISKWIISYHDANDLKRITLLKQRLSIKKLLIFRV